MWTEKVGGGIGGARVSIVGGPNDVTFVELERRGGGGGGGGVVRVGFGL